jgi:predicted site-specific integrase-resolvase
VLISNFVIISLIGNGDVAMLLSIGEMANKLGVCVGTLRRWDREGRFHPYRRTVGGHRRYCIDEKQNEE